MQTDKSRVSPEFWVLCVVLAVVFCVLIWSHQKTQQLRSECDARGGVLVQARSGFLCVLKESVIKIPGASPR